jgi:hypothetical protein
MSLFHVMLIRSLSEDPEPRDTPTAIRGRRVMRMSWAIEEGEKGKGDESFLARRNRPRESG